jgi:hypothetical protein
MIVWNPTEAAVLAVGAAWGVALYGALGPLGSHVLVDGWQLCKWAQKRTLSAPTALVCTCLDSYFRWQKLEQPSSQIILLLFAILQINTGYLKNKNILIQTAVSASIINTEVIYAWQ